MESSIYIQIQDFDARVRLKERKILGEQGVRSIYVLNLVNMVCDAYDYTVVEEDVMEDLENESQTSDSSKADYVCWIRLENNRKFYINLGH